VCIHAVCAGRLVRCVPDHPASRVFIAITPPLTSRSVYRFGHDIISVTRRRNEPFIAALLGCCFLSQATFSPPQLLSPPSPQEGRNPLLPFSPRTYTRASTHARNTHRLALRHACSTCARARASMHASRRCTCARSRVARFSWESARLPF